MALNTHTPRQSPPLQTLAYRHRHALHRPTTSLSAKSHLSCPPYSSSSKTSFRKTLGTSPLTITDATVVNGPSLHGLAVSLEKPGFFIVDYNVPKKDFRFQFMNTIRVAEKPLNLTYIHSKGDGRTILDGALVIDSANKVSANHMLGTGNTKLKYNYVHRGITTFEPSYDLGKNAWDFAISRKVYGDDVFRATYQTSSRNLGLVWSWSSKMNRSFMVNAVNVMIHGNLSNVFDHKLDERPSMAKLH